MGRKVIYKTKEEKKEAQLRWQREHYERNKEKLKLQARQRYRLKQQDKIRKETRNKLYGE
tara:strand:- start:1659 stop:1838 length:180 start_codon:yes stop_codon:yes gene_type:complete